MNLYLGLNLSQTGPIILPLVDFLMTFTTNWHLLAVNSRHVEAEPLQVLSAFADVF